MYEIILVGVALAMDAFALTVTNCITYKDNLSRTKKYLMPVVFGAFQFLMPVLGFFIGSAATGFLSEFAGFLTSGIFFALAIKFLIDAIAEKKSVEKEKLPTLSFATVLIQGIATSIDALFVGVTFAVKLSFSVFLASGIIGAVTFVVVAAALFIGKGLKKALKDFSSFFGVAILLTLAIINLIEALG
ncbi:MAG: manganese efflux pump [Clostridia bacterium]|nr:manganese efflux pump [Clostridia bacterium]